jgi:glycyl-tRNA synthetase beta chain
MNKTLLFEIGTEEIPASYLESASKQMETLLLSNLKSRSILHGTAKRFYTPRRLSIIVQDVATTELPKKQEVYGPPKEVAFDKQGNLTAAALGFAKAHKVDASQLTVKKKGKKEVICFEKTSKGRKTKAVLKEILPEIIKKIEFPKSMRWEAEGIRFARPVRWIVALFGEEVIPFKIAGVKSVRVTQSLRYHPEISLKDTSAYENAIRKAGIIIDPNERKEIIKKDILELSKKAKLQWVEDEELLLEVTNLVEVPTPILGESDKKYLKLPKDVIIAALKEHQRYFALEKSDGKLSPNFIAIANTKDGDLEKIRKNNEMILNARLEDAKFYFDEDMKLSLESRIDALKGVVWREELGSLYDKTLRIVDLSKFIARWIPKVNIAFLVRAAYLSKTDLLTNMIRDGKEFTKLEGIIGSEYAKAAGESKKICEAIAEQYLPKFPGDNLPKTREGVALSLADRIDTIAGNSTIDALPTGSFDPFGIRRIANGVVSIIMSNLFHFPLKAIIKEALKGYKTDKGKEEAFGFLLQRLRGFLEEQNIRYDIINSVIDEGDDFFDLYLRAKILDSFKAKEEFSRIVILSKRVKNILKGVAQFSDCKPNLLKEEAEKTLYSKVKEIEPNFNKLLERRDYSKALETLLTLGESIDRMFDEVLVMTPDQKLKNNRLALINHVSLLFLKVADFSKIEA